MGECLAGGREVMSLSDGEMLLRLRTGDTLVGELFNTGPSELELIVDGKAKAKISHPSQL